MRVLFNSREQLVGLIAGSMDRVVPKWSPGHENILSLALPEMPRWRAGGSPSYPALARVSASCSDPHFRGQLVTILSQDPESPLRELVQLKPGDAPVSLRKALLTIHSELKEEYPT